MENKNKLSVIVAVPAFNEEVNVGHILKELLGQKQNNFVLKKVVVYSDASTDETASIVKKVRVKHPIVKLIEGKKRRGKLFRLNQIFKNCQNSDVVVVLDADVG